MLLFVNYGPYHVARWRAANAYLAPRGVNLVPVQVAESEETYPWASPRATAGLPLVTLVPGKPYWAISPFRAALAMYTFLRKADLAWAAIPGYARGEFLVALAYLKARGKVTVLLSDSTWDDSPRRRAWEWCKGHIVRRFDAALVSGTRAAAYANGLGLPANRIFLGYDVIDNQYFAAACRRIRTQAPAYRARYGLPPRYFLAVGRLVPKKNFAGLLRSYAQYRQGAGGSAWDLVLCGSGPLEGELRVLAEGLGINRRVHFAGFRQVDELPAFYALAKAFILPSFQGEQWGLVVNEAMASGLPVLISRTAGCAADLVQEGVNGFTFDPMDENSLSHLMDGFSSGQFDLPQMGEKSQHLIAEWSPRRFAENLWLTLAR